MRERGILFSGPMVRAILAGRKTQTRRTFKRPRHMPVVGTMKYDPMEHTSWHRAGDGTWVGVEPAATTPESRAEADAFVLQTYPSGGVRCPYGAPGDRLWVREAWQQVFASVDPESNIVDDVTAFQTLNPSYRGALAYAANVGWEDTVEERGFPWRPSLLMPRWASRLTLAVESIRVERAQAISDADVEAEGMNEEAVEALWAAATLKRRAELWPFAREALADRGPLTDWRAIDLWRAGWTLINGRASWDANPWVWVVGFKVVRDA